VTTTYTYEVSEPELCLSQGNRLMRSRTFDSMTLDPIETRWYAYDKVGRTQRVVQAIAGEEDANGQWYRATDLWYDLSGRLWLSQLQRYQLIEDGDTPVAAT